MAEGNKEGVVSLPKSICAKVNVIAWLEFELAYFEVAVQLFSHYATWIATPLFCEENK